MAYTVVNPSGPAPTHARCFLKSSVPPAVPNKCCVSGVRRSAVKPGVIGGTSTGPPSGDKDVTGRTMGADPGGGNGQSSTASGGRGGEGGQVYDCRWDKIEGPGAPWSSKWYTNLPEPICNHAAAGCRCGNENFCGSYREGSVTYWWPQRCEGPKWTIKCSCRVSAAPSRR
jgi:hypothetical protein